MTETKLNITVEELAAFLAEHDSEAGCSWQNATREQRQQFNFQARRMLAADALYEALLNIEADLTGSDCLGERVADSLRRANAALALADGKGGA